MEYVIKMRKNSILLNNWSSHADKKRYGRIQPIPSWGTGEWNSVSLDSSKLNNDHEKWTQVQLAVRLNIIC